jgi:hypothetical protein
MPGLRMRHTYFDLAQSDLCSLMHEKKWDACVQPTEDAHESGNFKLPHQLLDVGSVFRGRRFVGWPGRRIVSDQASFLVEHGDGRHDVSHAEHFGAR